MEFLGSSTRKLLPAPILTALAFAVAGGGGAGCNKGAPADGPHAPPEATPTAAAVEVPPPGTTTPSGDETAALDLTEPQRRALATVRAAIPQDPHTHGPEIQQVLDQINKGEISFKGVTRGQLIRALGEPHDKSGQGEHKNHVWWWIGTLPEVTLEAPPQLIFMLDDAGIVTDARVQLSE